MVQYVTGLGKEVGALVRCREEIVEEDMASGFYEAQGCGDDRDRKRVSIPAHLERRLFHQSVVSYCGIGSLEVVRSLSPEVCNQDTMTEQVRMLGVDGSVRSAEENRTKQDNNA